MQSVPSQGKLPQVFETSAGIVARAEWNALAPRQMRPADMAVMHVDASGDVPAHDALVLLGPSGSFPAGTAGLHAGLQSLDLFRLDSGVVVDPIVDALEVGRVYFTEAATGINGGDLLLFVGKKGETGLDKLVLRASAVVAEPALKRIRVDVEALPAPVADPPPPPAATWVVPYVVKPILSFAKAQVSTVPFTGTAITATFAARAWRESELQAMIGIQGWSGANLVKAVAAPPTGPSQASEAGAFAFAAKLGFFGNNAPKWKILPPKTANTNGQAYPAGWDIGDDDGASPVGKLSAPRTIWQDSQGNPIAPFTYLERAVPDVNRMSWTVFDAPDVEHLAAQAYTVLDARETSRADFGLSGRAMRLRVGDDDGKPLSADAGKDFPFPFRSTTAWVASRRLDLADLPIETPLAAGETRIELDRMVLGLQAGQPVALVGERSDLPGVGAAEIAVLFRVNAQSEVYEQALTDAGVPYQVRGGERFFSRPEV
ncbi:MAG: hypothetical protein ACLGHY_05535, partial [Gammaproteobacteria bacterium]